MAHDETPSDHDGADVDLAEFQVTFGQKYSYEEHPVFPAAHPDGWVTILAVDADDARTIAVERLGTAWAFLYGPGADRFNAEHFPLGELARFTTGGA